MTLGILSMTFNDLTSLKRVSSEINTSKSETDPKLATKCYPRLNRGAGIDIMPRNRYTLSHAPNSKENLFFS